MHKLIEIIVTTGTLYLLGLATWLFYLAIMQLMRVRHTLHPFARVNAYLLLAIGIPLDVLTNVFIGSLLFLEPPHPKRLLLTARLSWHKRRDNGWRTKLAWWLCAHLLDQFDPRGQHCR
jgi:hypothetical protein